MKNTILPAILSLAIAAFAACGTSENVVTKTANSTVTNAATNNTTLSDARPMDALVNKSSDDSAKTPASNLKPEDVNTSKPVAADDLRNAVIADEKAWMGKEVAATGFPKGSGKVTKKGQPENIYANMANENKKWVLQCGGLAEKPETMKNNEKFVIKGTIADVEGGIYGEDKKYVVLKPCEIVT